MEQKNCDESRQGNLQFNCKEILSEKGISVIRSPAPVHDIHRKEINQTKSLEANIVSQTPDKTTEASHAKFKEEESGSSEKYMAVLKLFESMSCSLRLLNLSRKSRTFRNISTQVGLMTKRVFSHRHLAQMKYILPEAIQINKILVHDKETLCMKPDLEITLLFDVVEGHCENSDYEALRKVFLSRLMNFCEMHPEVSDIPEAILPEPFNPRVQNSPLKSVRQEITMEAQSTSNEMELFAEASHVHPSFRKHFSQKIVDSDREETQILSQSSLNFAEPSNLDKINLRSLPEGELSGSLCNQDTGSEQQKEIVLQSGFSTAKSFSTNSLHSISSSSTDSPQVKVPSTDGLMVETPTQLTPKRSIPSCDKQKTVTSQKDDSCLKPAKRILDFSVIEDDRSSLGSAVEMPKCRDDTRVRLFEVPETGRYFGDAVGSSKSVQKVKNTRSLNDEFKGQKSFETHQQKFTGMDELVFIIFGIFRSTNFSPITKEELLHKIIMNSLDITERREAEDQLELLEKLVPDWISSKSGPSGDIFYDIKKAADLDSIRKRLIST